MRTVLTWPVGHAAEAQRRPATAPIRHVLVYVGSCIVGGATTGLLLVSLALAARSASELLGVGLAAVAVSLAVVAVMCEWRGSVRPLPQRSRQVPRHWLLWSCRSCTAAAFGFMLGAGVFTHLLRAAMYVVVALVLLAPSVPAGLAIGAVYGGTRGAIVLVTWATDRWGIERPPWHHLAMTGPTSHRGLAVAAFLALAGAGLPTLLS